MLRTCGATSGCCAIAFRSRKVSAAVAPWWAVQIASVFGSMMHSAMVIEPIRNVLPTWRGMLSTTASAAYRPSLRLPRIAVPAPSCHGAKEIPSREQVARTAGQPVEVIPSGRIRCRAASESFGVELGIGGLHRLADVGALGLRRADALDLLRQRGDLPVHRSQRRPVQVGQRPDGLLALPDEDGLVGSALDRVGERLDRVGRSLLVGLHGPQLALRSHAAPPRYEKTACENLT